MILKIFSYLDGKSFLRLSLVSKQIRNIILQEESIKFKKLHSLSEKELLAIVRTFGEKIYSLDAEAFGMLLNIEQGFFITRLTTLQKLNLANKGRVYRYFTEDDRLQHIAKLTQLEELNLAGCISTRNRDLKHITKLTALQKLNLAQCINIGDDV